MLDPILVSVLVALLLIVPGMVSANQIEIYKMDFMWKDIPITIIVLDNWENMPGGCKVKNIAGCASYDPSGTIDRNVIRLMEQHLRYVDEYGYSTLYHEIKHIECKCDWHGDRTLSAIKKVKVIPLP